jgi:myosin-15
MWQARREPISTPFLAKDSEAEFDMSVQMFKLVLRYMSDMSMSVWNEIMLADYIVMLVGLAASPSSSIPLTQTHQHASLRDELYVQLINQTRLQREPLAAERCWQLMAVVASQVRPSTHLLPYALAYVQTSAVTGLCDRHNTSPEKFCLLPS